VDRLGTLRWNTKTSKIIFVYSKFIRKVILSSPCLCAPFTPKPLFQWYLRSKENLLNLGTKFWNSAFNAQDSRLLIVAVHMGAHVGPVKIYVTVVERSVERKEGVKIRWTHFTTKIDGFMTLPRRWMLMYSFQVF